jgi:hypothetical protein
MRQIPLEAFTQVRDKLGPVLPYLDRLRVRLEQTGYTPADSLLCCTLDAHARLQALSMELHYASCRSGVRRGE